MLTTAGGGAEAEESAEAVLAATYAQAVRLSAVEAASIAASFPLPLTDRAVLEAALCAFVALLLHQGNVTEGPACR